MTLFQQELLGHTYIDMIPRKNLVLAVATGSIEINIQLAAFKGLHPGFVIEMLVPAVKAGSPLQRLGNYRTDPAVATSKYGLQAT